MSEGESQPRSPAEGGVGGDRSVGDEIAIGEIIAEFEEDDDQPVQRRDLARVMQVIVRTAYSYSGPIPPAEEMERYNEVIPDAADRIMALTEREQAHRHEMEKRHADITDAAVTYDHRVTRRGQTFGLVISLAVLAVGVSFLVAGEAGLGAALVTATIVGLATIFVLGRRASDTSDSLVIEPVDSAE